MSRGRAAVRVADGGPEFAIAAPPGPTDPAAGTGGEGGIRTHVERNALNRFRVGAVMTASVPLRAGIRLAVAAALTGGGILQQWSRSSRRPTHGEGIFAAVSAFQPSS